MALCQYCGKTAIAWGYEGGRHAAFEQARNDDGEPIVAPAKNGEGRVVMRPVPGPVKHFPRGNCPVWSPALARERTIAAKSARFTRAPAPVVPPAPLEKPTIEPEVRAEAEALWPATAPGPEALKELARQARVGSICIPAVGKTEWDRAERMILRPESRIMLYGPPGTGKTSLPWRMAQREGWEHLHITLSEETPGSVLFGMWNLKAGSTEWLDGAVVRAWRLSHTKPVVMVFDEITRASVDCMSLCLQALDDPHMAEVILPTGERVKPNGANMRVVATSNDEPTALSAALASRLPIRIPILYPHQGMVDSLSSDDLKRLLVAESREFDPRGILEVDKMMRAGETLVWAFESVFGATAAQAVKDASAISRGASK